MSLFNNNTSTNVDWEKAKKDKEVIEMILTELKRYQFLILEGRKIAEVKQNTVIDNTIFNPPDSRN